LSVSSLRHERSRVEPGTLAPPVYLWSESKDKFTMGVPYREVFSEKKKGFGTGDYPRRDEFTSTVRTEQLRDIMKREKRGQIKATKAREKEIAKVGTALSTATSILQTYRPVALPAAPLYDVVMRIPQPSLKLERDDRQAKLWYMEERAKLLEAQKTMTADSAVVKPAPIAQWYSMKIDGRIIDVLVDESGQVVSQRPHGG
jgi:hypothetical protein